MHIILFPLNFCLQAEGKYYWNSNNISKLQVLINNYYFVFVFSIRITISMSHTHTHRVISCLSLNVTIIKSVMVYTVHTYIHTYFHFPPSFLWTNTLLCFSLWFRESPLIRIRKPCGCSQTRNNKMSTIIIKVKCTRTDTSFILMLSATICVPQCKCIVLTNGCRVFYFS